MIDRFLDYGLLNPYLPILNQEPVTLYAIMNSIANFGKEEQTKIKDLARATRQKIFDFNYPLSNKVKKDEFEVMILNHFLMRRINFQTFTLFKIKLENKLNVIMPKYNKLFDNIDLDFFEGEKITEKGTDDRTINQNGTATNTLNSETVSETTSDRRESDTPQNKIDDVKNGEYVSNYAFDSGNGKDTSKSNGSSSNNQDTKDKNISNKEITKINGNKLEIYLESENISHIYEMIFAELSSLFYGIY